jgi:hypothetical protein
VLAVRAMFSPLALVGILNEPFVAVHNLFCSVLLSGCMSRCVAVHIVVLESASFVSGWINKILTDGTVVYSI